MEKQPKRIRKHHIEAILQKHNDTYRKETGGKRGVYHCRIRKCYNPATEQNGWMVLTNFYPFRRYLGATLAEAYDRINK